MAELVSIKRNVDVSPGQAAPAVFHCSQGDVGSKIILGLLNNGTAYAIPSGVTVTIEGSESNGSIFTPISATASGSDITFYLTGEMTAVAGPAICQAVLKSGSNILGTANFTLEVESSPMGADAPPVFTDAGWTWMLNKLNTEFVPALGNETIIDAIEGKADQSDVTALSNAKLDKNQGTANAGKYLKVGADGNVETADLDVTTDKTLSITDKAADAKAVGDEITSLKADLSESVSNLKHALTYNGLADVITDWIYGSHIVNHGSTLGDIERHVNWRCCKIPCQAGDVFDIHVDSDDYTSYRAWAFIDASNAIIVDADKASEVTATIVAPVGAVYMVSNDYSATSTWTKLSYRGKSISQVVNKGVTENRQNIALIQEDFYELVPATDALIESNRIVSNGKWGMIPLLPAAEMEITPEFDVDSGTYNAERYVITDASTQAISLVATVTKNIGESVTFQNVTTSEYFAFVPSSGYLKYRYDSSQSFISKFSYVSNNKAVDYSDSQIAGRIVYKNKIAKVNAKQLAGKTIVFFGDSRTWYDGKTYIAGTKSEWAGKTCVGYQQAVKDLTGCNLINKGFSGYTSAQICEQIKLYDFSGLYAVYLSGGVNDFIKHDEIDVGEIEPIGSTFDTTTSYGAWQSAIEYLLNNYPQLKIYIDTPWVCWWYGNILPANIAEVKKNVADLYSIECLDMYHISGINVINRDYFYVDDISGNAQSRLHMNDYGNKWVGNIIGKYILSY